jgi:hypothetical protein
MMFSGPDIIDEPAVLSSAACRVLRPGMPG